MRLAAIDIGSNAARLLIAEVTNDKDGKPQFNKLNLVRVPLRLGFDVFEKKEISPLKTSMMLNTILSFKYLMDAYRVTHYKAAATSAMRDAQNGPEILQQAARRSACPTCEGRVSVVPVLAATQQGPLRQIV